MTRYRRQYVKVSRFDIIKKLVRKEYKKERPTGIQILELIHKHDLSLFTESGKKRSREAVGKAVAKAVLYLK
jgi:hypothetical protein